MKYYMSENGPNVIEPDTCGRYAIAATEASNLRRGTACCYTHVCVRRLVVRISRYTTKNALSRRYIHPHARQWCKLERSERHWCHQQISSYTCQAVGIETKTANKRRNRQKVGGRDRESRQ